MVLLTVLYGILLLLHFFFGEGGADLIKKIRYLQRRIIEKNNRYSAVLATMEEA